MVLGIIVLAAGLKLPFFLNCFVRGEDFFSLLLLVDRWGFKGV